MKFERIVIENFASYYDKHIVDLSTTPEKPVVIIIGGTGYGKTSLFDAINWALYGMKYEEQLLRSRKRNILDYVNEKAAKQAINNNEFILTACTLYFEHEGFHYYVTQEMMTKAKMDSKSKIKYDISDKSTVLYKIGAQGNNEKIDYNEIFLDEILPSNVRDYFLFDGDRISQLSTSRSGSEVKDAIFRVVDLEILEKLIEHFKEVGKYYCRLAKQESKDELKEVNEKYEKVEENIAKAKEDLKEKLKGDEDIKSQLKKLRETLLTLPDTASIQKEYDRYTQDMATIENQEKQNASNIKNQLLLSSFGLVSDQIEKLTDDLQEQREKGTIPQEVSIQLLKDIIDAGQCICGNPLLEGDDAYKKIMNRLMFQKRQNSGNALLDLLYALLGIDRDISVAQGKLEELLQKHDENNENYRKISLARTQVDSELKKMPQVNIANITSQIDEKEKDFSDNTRNIGRKEIEIDNLKKEKDFLNDKRNSLAQKQAEALKFQRRENLAKEAADTLDTIYKTFAEESRALVEQKTKNEFRNFVSSSSEYSISLNQNYELEIFDSIGNAAISRLSMGQSQCLSLSFITAIAKVSEKNPPLVIDMPLGRLDSEVHEKVSRRLPELASQLILFLIPGIEWNEITSKILTQKANHIYTLEFNKTTHETFINKEF